MKSIKLALAAIIISGVVGCSHLSNTNSRSEQEKLAIITDYEINDGYISFKTVGHGCTFYNNFKVLNSDSAENEIEIIQVKPDICQMSSREVSLNYSFRHLDLNLEKKVFLKNQRNNARLADIVSK